MAKESKVERRDGLGINSNYFLKGGKCMRKMFLVIATAILLCGCSSKEGNKENDNKTNTVESEDIDVTVDYMGDLNNKNGEVSFILSNPTSEKGFLIGTYKFDDIENFSPVVKTNIKDKYFDNTVEMYGSNRKIIMSKENFSEAWTNVLIADNFWDNKSNDYSINIHVEDYEYVDKLNDRNDRIDIYQYEDYYISIFQRDSYTFYEVFQFVEDVEDAKDVEDVVCVSITATTNEIDESKVETILDNFSIEYVSDVSSLDKNKYYFEDAVAQIVADGFDIALKNPYMVVGANSKSITYVKKIGDEIDNKTPSFSWEELKLGFLTHKPNEDGDLIATIGRYKIYDCGSIHKFCYKIGSRYCCIDFSNGTLTVDELKENYFS